MKPGNFSAEAHDKKRHVMLAIVALTIAVQRCCPERRGSCVAVRRTVLFEPA